MELENVIEDSINDAVVSEPVEDTSIDTSADTTTDDVSTDVSADASVEVTNPATTKDPAATDEGEVDEFAKRFGMQAQSVTGRENRIPYSRVRKIVEKNEKDTVTRVTKEVEAKLAPQLTEFQTKVKDYEDRLTKVAQFEHILENDPKTFLNMLSQVPAYKEFFDYIASVANGQPAQQQTQQSYLDDASMPQPDQTLADGSKVYSLDGLRKRDEWLARQVEEKAVKQAEERLAKRYAPIEQEWQARQRVQQVVPIIQKQIAEARTWPQFNENEQEIVTALKANPQLSLEGAYRQVVFPKLTANRDTMRASILDELKKKPVNTAAPTTQTKPGQVAAGPRSLEDIVREAAESLKR